MIVMQNIAQLYELYSPHISNDSLLHDYETNNWLKQHGKTMRRKPFKRKYCILDEYANITKTEKGR